MAISIDGRTITLDVAGLGIILHSPYATAHIAGGVDYLNAHYWNPPDVQAHIEQGTIVGFCTSSPGTYLLVFHSGYPDEETHARTEFKLRLAIDCRGGCVCVRDLYELMEWRAECPPERILELPNGFYHVTLCTNLPESGILGEDQRIDVYLQPKPELPRVVYPGVPVLCE